MKAIGSLDCLDARLKPQCRALLEATQIPGAAIAVVAGGASYFHAHGVKSARTGEPVRAIVRVLIEPGFRTYRLGHDLRLDRNDWSLSGGRR